MVKGFGSKFIKIYNESAKASYSVGEYWDGYDNIVKWIEGTGRTSAAFDFPFKFQVNDAFAGMDFSKLVWKRNGSLDQPAGLIHMDTYQRYFVQPANLIEKESGPVLSLTEQEQQVKELNEALQKTKNARLLVIGVLAFISLVLLIATINLALKVSFLKKEMNGDDETVEDEDDSYFEVFEEEKEKTTPKYERVVKPREPRTLSKVKVEEPTEEVGKVEEAEKAIKESKPVEKAKEMPKETVMMKKSVPVAEEEFFDKEDKLSEEFEAELLKAKVQEDFEDEFEDTMKPQKKVKTKEVRQKGTVKKKKTPESIEKGKKAPVEKQRVPREERKAVKGETETVRKQELKKKEEALGNKKKENPMKKPVKKSAKSLEMDFKEEDFDFEFIDLEED